MSTSFQWASSRHAVFAAKTTISALLALWVAFRFNLDDPKWAVLTVFIVAQPQSGRVFAKGFYRIIGTLVGATVALVLVSLFAQERVLFLGCLALWTAACTFGSKCLRNFASYACVLSGYTAAIVGIPAALAPETAFYDAQARITEISLGILVAATISHLVLPERLAASLRATIAASTHQLVDGALALLAQRDVGGRFDRVAGQLIEIETQRASAVFEDGSIRERSDAVRRLGVAMLGVIDAARLLDQQRAEPPACIAAVPDVQPAMRKAAAAIELWRDGKLDAHGLRFSFARAGAALPLARDLGRDPIGTAADAVRSASAVGFLRNFFAAFAGFAQAHDAFLAPGPPALGQQRFVISNDLVGAAWAGVRAALAVVIASSFWILANWPDGPTAVVLATVVTARFATMDGGAPAAAKAVGLFVLLTVPSFVVVEVFLARSSGYAMFSLVIAPLLFVDSWFMAKPRLAPVGFAAALYFASVAGLQNRMAYDAVEFVNTSLAAIFAVALAALLLAIVAPDTPQAARRAFAKTMRGQFARIAWQSRIDDFEFATASIGALDRLCRLLPEDQAAQAVDTGLALLSAGTELIRVRDEKRLRRGDAATAGRIAGILAQRGEPMLDLAGRVSSEASLGCRADLLSNSIDVAAARAAQRDMYAFAAASLALERTCRRRPNGDSHGEAIHAA
ncbi:MAG: FUSC family protein [Alphaproteobacteria bacterium]|nr:FUSC family protein [Alphaproteobacteria bacterium]MBV8407942.1 FUSC family protein [Alphaproteobacteria bacterium]